MASGMTKTQLVRHLAEKLESNNKTAAAFLEHLTDVAVKETKKNGVFVIPGLGRLVKAHRKARMGRNPQTGEPIQIKAKTVVKFRVAKATKDAIARPAWRSNALVLLVSAGSVVADVLFEGADFAAQIFNSPLQHVANGKHAQELAIVIHHRKVTEMALHHIDQSFPRTRLRSGQFYRRGHELANWRLGGVAPAQRKLAQHVT